MFKITDRLINLAPVNNPRKKVISIERNRLSSIIPEVVGVGKGSNGRLAVYDNISAEPNTFNHEPNYEELKNKNNEMESFMMPREVMK